MENFKYLIIAYSKINNENHELGGSINAKICMSDADYDYWMDGFNIVDKAYEMFTNRLIKRGAAQYKTAKGIIVKAITYDRLKKESESYKY